MRERRGRKQERRESVAMVAFSGGLPGGCHGRRVVAEPARDLSPGLALAFVAALALAAGIEFSVGAATAVPTQLVFVPMLLLLPTPYVPLLVAAAFALRAAWGAPRQGAAPGRALNGPPTRGSRSLPRWSSSRSVPRRRAGSTSRSTRSPSGPSCRSTT